jgi:phosphate transport system permease protein
MSSEGPRLFDPTSPLTATGNLRRRAIKSRIVDVLAMLAAAVAVLMMGFVVFTVIKRGSSVISFSFLTTNPLGYSEGGIVNSILGSIVIVALATAIAIPIGILIALYLSEFARPDSRIKRFISVTLEMLQGLPTIVVGLFIFGLIVLNQGGIESGFAGAVAVSIVMMPLVARSAQEMLALVPMSLREAADSLGVARWRRVTGVVLPAAAGGIATGCILAVARAAGETAPLLLCDAIYNPNTTQLNPFGHGVPSLPMYIYSISDLAIPDAYARAWGAALVLMTVILVGNIGARVLLARSRAKMGA